jgi:hypothetical protein
MGLNSLGVKGVALYDEIRLLFHAYKRCGRVDRLSPELDWIRDETPERNRKGE